MRRTAAASVLLLAVLSATGCGSTRTVTASTPQPVHPTAALTQQKAAEEAAAKRQEAREAAAARRAEQKKAGEQHATEEARRHIREEAERHAHEAKEHHEQEAKEHTEREREHAEQEGRRHEHEYPEYTQLKFIAGCKAHEGTESQCRCILHKLEVRDTLEEAAALAVGMLENVPIPEYMLKFEEECKNA